MNALDIARKWVARLGMGFHPDTQGEDYSPALSAEDIADYDADIARMFALEGDPYAAGLIAMEESFPENFR
jgi:hypothetical protein